MAIAAVLTDIEGTTTPIAFVHAVLFPYARTAFPEFLRQRASDPLVAAQLAEIARLEPGRDPLAVLLGWMESDAKITPLKTLQGMIWQSGFDSGALISTLYDDVAPALRAWQAGGIALAIYSSGSIDAQKLLFGHTASGDLTPLFSGFFDTISGMKRESESYARIARNWGIAAGEILFLSDVAAELDAARAACMHTAQLVRPQDATVASADHPGFADFAGVSAHFSLPRALL